jgi:hypothetical protein
MESEACKYFTSFCGADESSVTVIDLSWSVFYEREQLRAVSDLHFTDLAEAIDYARAYACKFGLRYVQFESRYNDDLNEALPIDIKSPFSSDQVSDYLAKVRGEISQFVQRHKHELYRSALAWHQTTAEPAGMFRVLELRCADYVGPEHAFTAALSHIAQEALVDCTGYQEGPSAQLHDAIKALDL